MIMIMIMYVNAKRLSITKLIPENIAAAKILILSLKIATH